MFSEQRYDSIPIYVLVINGCLLVQTAFHGVNTIFNRKINYIDFICYVIICKFPYKRWEYIGIHKFYAISVKIDIYTIYYSIKFLFYPLGRACADVQCIYSTLQIKANS